MGRAKSWADYLVLVPSLLPPFLFFLFTRTFCFACWLLSSPRAADDSDKKVVIPFDFVSKFDDGRYGQMMGDMLWKKLSRQGGFILPESMLDVRDYCTSHKIQPSAETELATMKKIVRG